MRETRVNVRLLCEVVRADVPENADVARLLNKVIRSRSFDTGVRNFVALVPRLHEMTLAQRTRLCRAVFDDNDQLEDVQVLLAGAIVLSGAWLPAQAYCDVACAAWFDDDVDTDDVLATLV